MRKNLIRLISVIALLSSLYTVALAVAFPLPIDPARSYTFTLRESEQEQDVTVKPGEQFTLELILRADTLESGALDDNGYHIVYGIMDEIEFDSHYLNLVDAVMVETFGQNRDLMQSVSTRPNGRDVFIRANSGVLPLAGYSVRREFIVARMTFATLDNVGETKIVSEYARVSTITGRSEYAVSTEDVTVTIINEDVPPPASRHTITVTNPANGTITTSPVDSAQAGEQVNLSISLTGGYTLRNWQLTGATVISSAGVTGAYFIMPDRDVSVTAVLNAPTSPVLPPSTDNPGGGGNSSPLITIDDDDETPLSAPEVARFDDVAKTHWAFAHVEYLAELGFVNGKTANLFYPNDTIIRGEFVTILARMSGENLPEFDSKFSDVKADAYYARPVAWAISSGVTLGTSDTTFSPDAPIQRQQIAAMIARYAAYRGFGFDTTNEAVDFTDKSSIAQYAAAAVTAMQRVNIISGYPDGSFRPTGRTTRAEAAKMLALVHDAMFPGLVNQG